MEAADGTSKISTAEWRGNLPVGLGQTDRITDTSFDELVKNARRSGGIERYFAGKYLLCIRGARVCYSCKAWKVMKLINKAKQNEIQ